MDNILYDKLYEHIKSTGYVPVRPEELCSLFSADYEQVDIVQALGALIDNGLAAYVSGGRITATENSNLLRGTFRSNAKGFGFFIPDPEFASRIGGDDLLIRASDRLNAVNDDYVLCVQTSQADPDNRKNGTGRIVKIIERRLKSVIGTLCVEQSGRRGEPDTFFVSPDDGKIDFDVDIIGEFDAAVGDKVEAVIDVYPDRNSGAKGHISAVFGDSEDTGANYSAILHENGIRTFFDDEVLAEADSVSSRPLSSENRTDMRGKIIMTIDSAEAKDLDDAISVERTENDGYILGVHIADVSDYVRAGTALDREAFERGTSVYFADKVVPMLPEAISNGCCSLNCGEDKYTLSALIEIDGSGEILGCNLCEGIIKTTVRGVYSEVNDILDKGETSEFFEKYRGAYPMFPLMSELYSLLLAKSEKRGALDLDTKETKIVIENGFPVDIVAVERGTSERMIEQFMLAANEAVANWLFWQDMPCVYRVHEDPDPEKIRGFAVFAHNIGLNSSALSSKKIHSSSLAGILRQAKEKGISNTVNYMLLRSLMKAKYSPVCIPHFGLAIEKYCHFTSPIRRYPDLSVHRIIKAVLHGETDGDKTDVLARFAERSALHSSEAEVRAVNAERAIDDLYRTVYMEDKVGEIFDGVISSVTSFGLFVELDNTCEGMVPIQSLNGYFEYNADTMTLTCGYTTYSLGQHVSVEIVDCDIISRRIEMDIVPDGEY